VTGKQLVGTWALVSAEARRSDGTMVRLYGEHPQGLIMYDAMGNMSVNLMRSDRSPFSVPDKAKSTLEEAKAAIETYEAYFGTYEVDEGRGVVIHRVEGSLLPNWTGSDQLRFYELLDDSLILSTAEIPYSGTTVVGKLTWKRAA
jgi:hypothetical protein